MTHRLDTADRIQHLSLWIDHYPPNQERSSEARTWGRLAKVGEEFGEVIAAYIAVTGQNPRKGAHGVYGDVVKELFDVALTALCAVEHMTGNVGIGMEGFHEHVINVHARSLPTTGQT